MDTRTVRALIAIDSEQNWAMVGDHMSDNFYETEEELMSAYVQSLPPVFNSGAVALALLTVELKITPSDDFPTPPEEPKPTGPFNQTIVPGPIVTKERVNSV